MSPPPPPAPRIASRSRDGADLLIRCAIDRFIKSPKCYACGAPTSGIYNKAEKILAKLEAKQKQRREERGIVKDEADEDGGIQIGGASDEEGSDGEAVAPGAIRDTRDEDDEDD